MPEYILETEKLNITLLENGQRYAAVRGVSLQIPSGKQVGIIGESGCGKSLTCHSVMGLLTLEKWEVNGTIRFLGEELPYRDQKKMNGWRGLSLALIAQDPMNAFDPRMTLRRHFLELPRRGRTKREILDETAGLLARMRLAHPEQLLDSYAFQLSGGMLQRVMIAMAVVGHPRLLIADEPTTALDVTVQREILQLLREMQRETGLQLLMVSHDLQVIAQMTDVIYVMYAGYVVESAPADELLRRPLHPYTEKLLASRPAFSKKRLSVMAGSPPGLHDAVRGCPFAPRCPKASPECREQTPELLAVGKERTVRCGRYNREETHA